MIAFVDVQYSDDTAFAACVTSEGWSAQYPATQYTVAYHPIAAYEPGAFWKRELPPVRAVLNRMDTPPSVIVIDGYVWLSGEHERGLGARLFEALDSSIPVVGVAKSEFRSDDFSVRVVRGSSQRPLFITSAGISPDDAAAYVESMSGPDRIPLLLRAVDRLAREFAQGATKPAAAASLCRAGMEPRGVDGSPSS